MRKVSDNQSESLANMIAHNASCTWGSGKTPVRLDVPLFQHRPTQESPLPKKFSKRSFEIAAASILA